MNNEWNLIALDDFGVLRLRGPDAVRFLQGQVSNDVEQLSSERSQLTGYHNPQGRAIAVLRLVQLAPDDLLAILPSELAAKVASRLGKFILRAKVKIADESAAWRVAGLVAPHVIGERRPSGRTAASESCALSSGAGGAGGVPGASENGAAAASQGTKESTAAAAASQASKESTAAAAAEAGKDIAAAFESRAASWAAAQFEEASVRVVEAGEQGSAAVQLETADSVVELPTARALMLPDAVNAQSRSDGSIIIRVGMEPARWLVVSPVGEAAPVSGCAVGERDAWRLLDIADGIPQVYAATSEEFVAQMLNLDVLGGISFGKGCYTGQEVIARAHYRGRVKRRLQRFMSREPVRLAVGESGQLADGRSFKVVEAAELANGRCEFLAVAPIASGSGGAEEDARPAAGASGAAAGQSAPPSPVDARALHTPAASVEAAPPESATVDAEQLALPYALPA
jgi:folate-binding protein YgfZ